MTTITQTPVTIETIQMFRDAFENDASAKVAQNAVTMNTIDDIELVLDVEQ